MISFLSLINRFFRDKVVLFSLIFALVAAGSIFYISQIFFSSNDESWFFATFAPVSVFVVAIFVVNLILSLVSYLRDYYLAYLFNCLTVFCCLLLLLAVLLKVYNPNG